jgi:hypothetical protein
MYRYFGVIIDVIFVTASLILAPAIIDSLTIVSASNPNVEFHLALYTSLVYPLACWAILHKIVTVPATQKGLFAFNSFIWRWYSWPLGILFFIMVFAHSGTIPFLWMIMGSRENPILSMEENIKGVIVIIFILVISLLLVWRTGKILDWFGKGPIIDFAKGWFVIIQIIYILILLPILISIIILIPFLLYFGVWCIAPALAKRKRLLLPNNYLTKIISSLILFFYTIMISFYFELLSSTLFDPSYHHTQTEIYLFGGMIMGYFYIPFRIFFALSAGRNIIGWFAFVLSLIIVYINIIVP